MVGPQTTRNGVIAIDPHTIRIGVAWDHGLAGTEAQRAIKRPNAKTERIAFFQLISPLHMWCAGRTAVTCDGLSILLKSG